MTLLFRKNKAVIEMEFKLSFTSKNKNKNCPFSIRKMVSILFQ